MREVMQVATICEELSAAFRNAVRDGKAFERIDELAAACERARQEITEIARR